jgi:hypothetical protein
MEDEMAENCTITIAFLESYLSPDEREVILWRWTAGNVIDNDQDIFPAVPV